MDFGAPGASPAPTPVARAENYSYDSLNRLTATSGTTGVPAKSLSYNAQGNILTKDGRTYTYGNTAKPHQITQITGSIHGASNPVYSYDANGNILTGGGATVSWMSFNMVNSLTQGSQSSTFRYGPEHQQVKQTAAYNGQNITTGYLSGVGAGNFELEKNTSSNTTQAKYCIAGKVLYLEVGTDPVPSRTETKYLHKDHLGSVVLITNSMCQAQERYSYDAWGKRRNLNGTDYTANGGHLLGVTDRGYTGHEHLDHLGLVHMNGRIYDASLGRFLSADPFIAQPHNLQNYNRYAYVNNNPLSYTDPSGYFLKKLFKNKVFRIAVGVGLAVWTGGALSEFLINNQIGWFTQFSGAFSDGWMLTAAGKAAVGAAGGFAGALGASGGDVKAALNGGVSGALFGFAGTVGMPNDPSRYFAHAAAGCVSSTIGGADCDQGASAALAGKLVTNHTPQSVGGPEGFVAASVAGGTASMVTGGKFGNGAYTAAYGYLYNYCAHNGCFDRRFDWNDAVDQWRNGNGSTVTDVKASELNLTDARYTKNPDGSYQIHTSIKYDTGAIYGTVTGVLNADGTLSIRPDTYNFDVKWSQGASFRNFATVVGAVINGFGKRYNIEFTGTLPAPEGLPR